MPEILALQEMSPERANLDVIHESTNSVGDCLSNLSISYCF